MMNPPTTRTIGALAAVLMGVFVTTACSNSTPGQPAAGNSPATEIGRFQMVVAPEGERSSVVFLVDTKDGATWIYRPPQGTAINGFWSDIPRLTYAPEYWRTVFTQQPGAPQPETAPPGQSIVPGVPTVPTR